MAERVVINNPVADALNRLVDTGINQAISVLAEDKRYKRNKADQLAARDESRAYQKKKQAQDALTNIAINAMNTKASGLSLQSTDAQVRDAMNVIESQVELAEKNKELDIFLRF